MADRPFGRDEYALQEPMLGSSARVLPRDAEVVAVYDEIRAGFPAEDWNALHLVAAGPVDPAATEAYARELSRVAGVVRVDSAVGSFAGGDRVGDRDPDELHSIMIVMPVHGWLAEAVARGPWSQ